MDHQLRSNDFLESERSNIGNPYQRPVGANPEQLRLCQQVKNLFFCNFDQVPTQESCLIALANQQYSDVVHLFQFSIFQPIKLLYQLQSDQFLLFSADHQYMHWK